MTIVQMWNYGVVSIGQDVNFAAFLCEREDPLLCMWLRKVDDRIEDMWQFDVVSLKDMQHFRKIFRLYAKKRFGVHV